MTTAKIDISKIKIPKLLKARQFHSRIFAVLVIGLILVSQPMLHPGTLPRHLMLWSGYILVIFGAFGRIYCSAFIGGRKNDEIVRSGPFSIVRNPLYVFSFLAVVGIGLESGMFLLVTLLCAAFIFYYQIVVAKEEAFLKDKFGAPYEAYLKEVPRWIPKFKLWNEPEQFDAKPKFIRRTAMDAAIFFLPLPCFIFITMMHAYETLPVWFTLP